MGKINKSMGVEINKWTGGVVTPGVGRGQKRGFWRAGNTYYLDVNGGYGAYLLCKNPSSCILKIHIIHRML